MKTIVISAFILSFFCACSSTKKVQSNNMLSSSGNTRTIAVAYLDDNTYKLEEVSADKTFGYTQENPVKVGGSIKSGPKNERRFLNGLTGPNGEPVQYRRTGSCCAFKTPNGFDGFGMLDRYKVYWEGSKDTTILYLNMYDEGDLKVPVGFTKRSSL